MIGKYYQLVRLWRWFSLILGLRVKALLSRSTLELNVSRKVLLGKGVRIELQGKHNKITIGPQSNVGNHVHIVLNDGELYIGERGQLRHECVAHISGKLYLERACGFSIRCVIHCGKSIEIGHYTIFGEYCSVLDGEHIHTQNDDYWFYGDPQAKNILKGVKVGVGAYIGAKTTVVKGAEIGDFCRVGANSVVTGKLEPHTLSVGVPAKVIKQLV